MESIFSLTDQMPLLKMVVIWGFIVYVAAALLGGYICQMEIDPEIMFVKYPDKDEIHK